MEDAIRERFAMDRHGMQMGGHYFVCAKALQNERRMWWGIRYVSTSKETTVVLSALLGQT